jgi:hypothetical protein
MGLKTRLAKQFGAAAFDACKSDVQRLLREASEAGTELAGLEPRTDAEPETSLLETVAGVGGVVDVGVELEPVLLELPGTEAEPESGPEPGAEAEPEPGAGPGMGVGGEVGGELGLKPVMELDKDSCSSELDRPLELDEPRWYRQHAREWASYSNRQTRTIENAHRIHKANETAVLKRRSKNFYQERLENIKTGVSMNEGIIASLVDKSEYQTDCDHVDIGDNLTIDFTKMKEQSRTESGGNRFLGIRRYEPTMEDRSNAIDARNRAYVLRELVSSEGSYVRSLISLQTSCFVQLQLVEANWSEACRDLVSFYHELVLLQTEFFGTLEDIIARPYLDEAAIIDALGAFVSKTPIPYAQFVSHFDSFTTEIFALLPELKATEKLIMGILIQPVQRVPRYKLFVDRLLKDMSEAIGSRGKLVAIHTALTAVLDKLNEQPRMVELKQWKMPLSSDVSAVPNTVVLIFPKWFRPYAAPYILEMSQLEQLRTEIFEFPNVKEVDLMISKAMKFVQAEQTEINCVLFVDVFAGSCTTHDQLPVVAQLEHLCASSSIKYIALHVPADNATGAILNERQTQTELRRTMQQIVRHLNTLRYRTAVRMLARGPIECERVYEIQTWLGIWGKPTRMPEYCTRNGREIATRPDLTDLPYESDGLWIWLGDWQTSIVDKETDDDGWQYARVMPTQIVVPTTGWQPLQPTGTQAIFVVRRRLFWRFRQRLKALGGFKDKLQTTNWTLARTMQKLHQTLEKLSENDTPLDKPEAWNATAMYPVQQEVRDAAAEIIYSETMDGHKDLAEWFLRRLQTGGDATKLKVLWMLDNLISSYCKRSQRFQSILRLVIARGVAACEHHPQKMISALAVECSRRLSQQVQLPMQTHCSEHDLQRVNRVLQELEQDPLRCQLTQTEQDFLWDFRNEPLVTRKPSMLAKVLLSVPDWEDTEILALAHALPTLWTAQRIADHDGDEDASMLPTAVLLQMLDPQFWDNALHIAGIDSADPTSLVQKACRDRHRAFGPIFEFVVCQLDSLSDSTLSGYMLQLAQVVKHKDLLSSTLPQFLLRRALAAPGTTGHALYWYIRAEMMACLPKSGPITKGQRRASDRNLEAQHDAAAGRAKNMSSFLGLGLILRSYLDLCGERVRQMLLEQEQLVKRLRNVVQVSVNAEDARRELRDIVLPPNGVRLPVLDVYVDKLSVHECRMMSSATKPLLLSFHVCAGKGGILRESFVGHVTAQTRLINRMMEDGVIDEKEKNVMRQRLLCEQAIAMQQLQQNVMEPTPDGLAQMATPIDDTVAVIFKDGDDLRQDGLVLQSFKLMQDLWRSAKLDIPLNAYRTVDLGGEVGMIEVVPDCVPLAKISVDMKTQNSPIRSSISVSSNIAARHRGLVISSSYCYVL